jgi:hypothetical protein
VVLVELGEGVTRVRVGDRVCPIFAQQWLAGEPTRDKARSTLGGPLDGTLAELMAVDQEGLVKAPDHLTDEEALQRLSELLHRVGYLNCHVIGGDENVPSAATYVKRFGSLDKAYARVGFIRLTPKERLSPVGRARIAAARPLQGAPERSSVDEGPDQIPGRPL